MKEPNIGKYKNDYSLIWLMLYFLAVITPTSIDGNPEALFTYFKVGFMGLGFIGLIVSEKAVIQTQRFLLVIFLMIMGSIFSIPHIENVSILRLFLYILILMHFASNYEKIDGADKLFSGLIIFTVVAFVISILYPNFFFSYYSWNSMEQSMFFLENQKFVTLFGLHSTAAFVYGLFAFWLISSNKITIIQWSLFFIFSYFLLIMNSVSAYVSILFVSFIFLRRFFSIIFLVIFFLISIVFLNLNYFNFDLQNQYALTNISIANRVSEAGIGFDIYELLFSPIGFYNQLDAYWGDFGYLDIIRRFGFFALLYYFAYFKMFSKNLFFEKNLYIFILFLFIHEFGHTYSKSRDFFPIIILLIFAIKTRYPNPQDSDH